MYSLDPQYVTIALIALIAFPGASTFCLAS